MPKRAVTFLMLSCLLIAGCEGLIDPFGTKIEAKLPGQRLVVLSENRRLIPDEAIRKSTYQLPVARAIPAWPMQGGNSRHLLENLGWSGNWQQQWLANIAGSYSENHPLQASVISAGHQIFAVDEQQIVTAARLEDAHTLWQFHNKTTIPHTSSYGGGLALGQGVLILTTGYGDVVALDAANGSEKWRVSLRIPIRGPATILNNQALIQTLDSQAFAFNLKDGREVWYHAGINEITSVLNHAAPAGDESQAYLAYNSGEVAAIDSNSGKALWLDALSSLQRSSELTQINAIAASPIVINQSLLISGYNDQMVLFDKNSGQRIWEQEIGTLHQPWVSGTLIFVMANDQRLYALDLSSGKLRWVMQPDRALHRYRQNASTSATTEIVAAEFNAEHWGAPVMVNDLVLLLSQSGILLQIDPASGAIQTMRQLEFGSRLPIQVSGGLLLVIGIDGRVAAYR